MRNFIRFQNIFNSKNLRLDQVTQKNNVLYYGTKANASGFSKAVLLIGGLGVGGGLYGYLAAPERKDRHIGVGLSEERDYVVRKEIPSIKPSRQVQGPANNLDLELTLYQYQNCPFCCKVRAFLDFHGIPYNVIEVNPVMRQQVKFSDYKKVPILIAKDKKSSVTYQLNDSSVIISILGTFLLDPNSGLENVLKFYVPYIYKNEEGKRVEEVFNTYSIMHGEKKAKRQTDESLKLEKKWRKWADEYFVHILSPNIYRTFDEALQAFNYFSEVGEWEKNFSPIERLFVIYVGASAMYLIGKKLKKKHSLKDDVRQSLYDACNQWMKIVGSKRKFLGGDVPNLADLAVFGLLNSIEGCTAFQELKTNTNISTWYDNVKESVSGHRGYEFLQ